MKPLKLLSLFTGILATGFINAAPNQGGCVKGRVTWDETKQPIISATIAFENETTTKGFFTHEKGRFYACYIPEGMYTITVSFGAITITVPNVTITDGSVQELNFSLPVDLPVISFDAAPITASNNLPVEEPKTEKVAPSTNTVQSENTDVPMNNLNMWSSTFPRSGENTTVSWYVDGCKVMGSPGVPLRGVESLLTYSGSIPAKYGDTNGMVVAVETRSLLLE